MTQRRDGAAGLGNALCNADPGTQTEPEAQNFKGAGWKLAFSVLAPPVVYHWALQSFQGQLLIEVPDSQSATSASADLLRDICC